MWYDEIGLFRPVAVSNAHQHNQALRNLSPGLAVGRQGGAAGSDYNRAHGISPFRFICLP